jgi:hypothetical protein
MKLSAVIVIAVIVIAVIVIAVIAVVASLSMVDATPVLDRRDPHYSLGAHLRLEKDVEEYVCNALKEYREALTRNSGARYKEYLKGRTAYRLDSLVFKHLYPPKTDLNDHYKKYREDCFNTYYRGYPEDVAALEDEEKRHREDIERTLYEKAHNKQTNKTRYQVDIGIFKSLFLGLNISTSLFTLLIYSPIT